MKSMIILMMALLVVAACAQTQPAQPAPVEEEEEPQVVFVEDIPEETPEPVPEPTPVKIALDAAELDALNKNLGPGKKIALSSPRVVIPIGESKVVGIAWRAVNQPAKVPVEYQLQWRLVRGYDRYTNIITRESNDIASWFERNQNRVGPFAFEPVSFTNTGEYRQAFVIDVKPMFDNGEPTKPGQFELEINVRTPKFDRRFIEDYAKATLTIQVTE